MTGQAVTPPLEQTRGAVTATFSAQGDRLVTIGVDGSVRVCATETGETVAGPLHHAAAVASAAFSPDGRLLLTRESTVLVRVWDLAGRAMPSSPLESDWAGPFPWLSPDGRWLVTRKTRSVRGLTLWDARLLTTCVSRAGNRYQVQVWHAATGHPVTQPLIHPQTVWHETFNSDGRLVATGCADGGARIWDAISGKPRPFLAKHGGPVRHVAFSPDSRRFLTASDDGTARIWDATTGQLVVLLRHDSAVWQALFASDRYSVITASMDNRVRLWPLAPDDRPLDDWVAVAGLLGGGSAEASIYAGREEDLVSIWQTLWAKYPGNFATTQTEQRAWHKAALETAYKKKSWQAALAHLTRLLDIDSADWQNRLARARLLARLERWHQADAEFTRVVERHPRVPEGWVARGSYFLSRGQGKRAETDFIKAIDLHASPHLHAVLSEFWVTGLYPEDLQASFLPETQLDPFRPLGLTRRLVIVFVGSQEQLADGQEG